ncbi:MAG: glucose-6-phosphate isomerase [Rhodospirillales bacterium]|nr:glucose-6-phosphate isomerase [Rhodospirillales bacterium]
MHYQQDISACLSPIVGDRGLSQNSFNNEIKRANDALDWFKGEFKSGRLPAFDVCSHTDDIVNLSDLAEGMRDSCDTIAILGTGGSSLGAQTVCALSKINSGPKIKFLDNIDPYTLDRFIDETTLDRLGLLIISKSGSTMETLAQAVTIAPELNDFGPNKIIVITENSDSPLKQFSRQFNLMTLDHDPNIGGRFSAFSMVGVLPALLAGIDVQKFRAGAYETLSQALIADQVLDVPSAVGSAVSVALYREKATRISVLMSYSDRLSKFSHWYRQLCAESLAKGGEGMTPIAGLGTVDQHSQLQLYLDGPNDKMFTFLSPRHGGIGATVDNKISKEIGLDYAADCTVGDLIDAAHHATHSSIIAKGHPTRLLTIDKLNEASLGALMMHYMLETVMIARLLDINPFNQPAVEDGKLRAQEYLKA